MDEQPGRLIEAVRLIQVYVPDDARASVTNELDDAGIEYRLGDEAGDGGVLAHVPVPTGAVDAVLELLYDAGLDEETYTVVTDVDRATVPNVDALTEQYVEGPEGEASYAEIRRRAEDMRPRRAMYLAFAVFSAVVAVGGLFLNSAIVIVGAMVISPFASSTLSGAVGAVIDDREMVVESATSQLSGMVVAFASAVAMSAFLRETAFVPATLAVSRIDRVSAFATPNLLTFAIALSAGVVGALALATDLPVSLAGVAVAAALVPAVAAAGLGVVWGKPLLVLGALVLVFMNVVFINLSAYAGLAALGYRTSVVRDLTEDVSLSARSAGYALVVALFVVALAGTSVATYQHLGFEQSVNRDVQTVLADETYDELELVGVQTQYSDVGVLGQPESVTVTVSRTTGSEYPNLADRLRERIRTGTGRSVSVEVRYVDTDRSRPPPGATQPAGELSTLADWFAALRESVSRRLGRAVRLSGV